ncbi:MAG TPA: oligosaccharide flippase family protein [Puia sp.]|nr:oligosaccharide flippase family protein [Puia sp.]
MEIREISLLREFVGKYRKSASLGRMLTVLSMDVLARLSNIILLPVYLRLMTQDEYGWYNYLLSIISTFALILNFGLYVAQTKYYSDSHQSERRKSVLFNVVLALTLMLALVVLIIYACGFDYKLIHLLVKTDIGYSRFRWSLLLAVIVSVYIVMLSNYFVTSEQIGRFRQYNLFRLLLVNVIVVASLYFLRGNKIHIRLEYTYLVEMLILLIFSVYYIREMKPGIDKGIIWSSLRLGLPYMLSAIWGLLSNYSDKYFLEKYGNAKDLSYYYLAFSIANVLYMVCLAVQNSWLPTFLREKDIRTNIRMTKRMLTRLTTALLILAALLMLGLYLAIRWKIIAAKYSPALPVLPFLLIAQILNGLVLLTSNYMIYFEKTHWALFVGLPTSVIGLAMSYLLVPRWGTVGAVTAYLTVQLAYLFIYRGLIKRQLKRGAAGELLKRSLQK